MQIKILKEKQNKKIFMHLIQIILKSLQKDEENLIEVVSL